MKKMGIERIQNVSRRKGETKYMKYQCKSGCMERENNRKAKGENYKTGVGQQRCQGRRGGGRGWGRAGGFMGRLSTCLKDLAVWGT